MLFTQKRDERRFVARIFFDADGEVNRRHIIIAILTLVLIGALDRFVK